MPAPPPSLSIEFVNPDAYVDASAYGRGADKIVLATLEQHLRALGQHCLKSGERLSIRILDIDLAGGIEWHPDRGQVRLLREVYWPRLELAYRRGDSEQPEFRESVSDMDYLRLRPYLSSDYRPLPYERHLLNDWFSRRFCPTDDRVNESP